MMNADNALAAALAELAALGIDRDREQIAALRDRLDAARLRVLVAGEAKRGKSTLINALLGRAVLPTGVTPLTAVATTVRYGSDPYAQVRFGDGHEEKQPISALPDLVTERGNPGNRRRIASVTVYLDAPLLAGGLELVDTPGTGSVFTWDTAAAHEALETMDAAVFVLTADPPVSAAERDLYTKVSGMSVATFAVLNKSDHLDQADLDEEVLDDELRAAPPAEIERRGRERLVELTLAAADAWRGQRREIIEEGLAGTDARLAADLTAALEVLRLSAAELLGLDLAVPEPGGRLAEDNRFFYTTADGAGQTELLAGAIRRRLPGELGRRSAREHLRREAPGLAESQLGQARGDLQYRLSEASRPLARSIERRYAEATGRMRAALQAAEELRAASAAEAAVRERELSRRAAAVRHALTLLDQAGQVSGPLAP